MGHGRGSELGGGGVGGEGHWLAGDGSWQESVQRDGGAGNVVRRGGGSMEGKLAVERAWKQC